MGKATVQNIASCRREATSSQISVLKLNSEKYMELGYHTLTQSNSYKSLYAARRIQATINR